MLCPLLGVVATPVRQTLPQRGIIGTVVELQQPCRGLAVAVVVVEHGAEGSDDASAVHSGSGRLVCC